ncbi:pinensin family lanthipeptide [Roseivirga sp. BDSF3-8]
MKKKMTLDSLRIESFVTKHIRGGVSFEQETELYPSINCDPGEKSYTCP